MMQLAGYPLSANDLSIEEWLDLGRLNETLKPRDEHRNPQNSNRSRR